ncbi:MAG: hypothetical protein AB7P40_26680 [Chloroflexota bacterium]
MDYLRYYDLESYLFENVRSNFHEHGRLNAFDFFSIVIWKANRSKSRIAARLLAKGFNDLEAAVTTLTSGIAGQQGRKERLYYLWNDWGFRLPMASAILTVLYPDDFTIYDYRVCDQLGDFYDLATRSNFEDVWHGYEQLVARVHAGAPAGLSLRDKDRYLWGKSIATQLEVDLAARFGK